MSNLLNPKAKGTVDDFLANAPDMEEDQVEELEEEEEEAVVLDPIDALLMDFPNAPQKEVIEKWKAHFGSVHAFVPNGNEAYLFRPLRRVEYTNIAKDIARLRETAAAQADPSMVETTTHEKVVSAAMLWPNDLGSLEKIQNSPAGLFTTLFELIMRTSHFIAPEQAMASCYRL